MKKMVKNKIVTAIKGYISKVVPTSKWDNKQSFINKKNNVVYLKQPPSEMSGKKLYAERKYHTWNGIEIALVFDKVETAIKSNTNVNLSELKEFMPDRSISSIRCKVLWTINRLTKKHIGTYTVPKDNKEIKK